MAKTIPAEFPDIQISRVRTGRPIRGFDWRQYPLALNWLWSKSGSFWPGIVWDPAFVDTSGNTKNDDSVSTLPSGDLVFNSLFEPYRPLADGSYSVEIAAYLIAIELAIRIEDVGGTGGTTVTATLSPSDLTPQWVRSTVSLDARGPWVIYLYDVNQIDAEGKVLQIGAREARDGLSGSDIP